MPMPFRGHSISPARNGADGRSCDQAEGDGEFDRREIRRDAAVTYDPAGIIVVASAWLAFYVVAVIQLL